MNKEFWNERYSSNASVYGVEPNEFFRDQLSNLEPGKILLPAEGEGRNAVFAASKGWKVHAFDYSDVAQSKALRNAQRAGVHIDYDIADISQINLPKGEFDVVALIYVHLPELLRKQFHLKAIESLKEGGEIILEAFAKRQLENASGGPRNILLLYSLDDLLEDFKSLKVELGEEREIVLDEGPFHEGKASVVRVCARKRGW